MRLSLIVLACLAGAAVWLAIFNYRPFWIPSGAMKPTLLIGDYLIVDKTAYRFGRGAPERGDVIVFRHPVSNQNFIERLVGLPGDRVQMSDGILHINGRPLRTEQDGSFNETFEMQGSLGLFPRCANSPVPAGGVCEKARLTETTPEGRSYAVLDTDMSALDNTPVYNVPMGHYFFMGDNRDNSNDSRINPLARGVGFVPAENLVGRARIIVFSSHGEALFNPITWREGRGFKAIR